MVCNKLGPEYKILNAQFTESLGCSARLSLVSPPFKYVLASPSSSSLSPSTSLKSGAEANIEMSSLHLRALAYHVLENTTKKQGTRDPKENSRTRASTGMRSKHRKAMQLRWTGTIV